MPSKIKNYNSEQFREEYFNAGPKLKKLFDKSIRDFFCLRIEELIERVTKPIAPSREESHTLIYVTKGSYKTKIGFREYTVTAGEIVVLQAGAVFSTENISNYIEGFTCHFHPNILIGKYGNRALTAEFVFLEIGNHPIIRVPQRAKDDITHLFERLTAEFKSDTPTNPNIVHSYLHTLLTELRILTGNHGNLSQSAAARITTDFRRLVHERVKENLKAADFAELLNVSPNHLNKSVKTVTSKSASQIIDEIKLIEIKFLLYQSGLSVSEIAHAMGFQDASYFTRFFKKRENVSPSEFCKLIEKS